MATTAKIAREDKTLKYKIRAAQPVQAVRPAPRLLAEVRPLPALLPQGRARGRCDGRHEEQLVKRAAPNVRTSPSGCSSNDG